MEDIGATFVTNFKTKPASRRSSDQNPGPSPKTLHPPNKVRQALGVTEGADELYTSWDSGIARSNEDVRSRRHFPASPEGSVPRTISPQNGASKSPSGDGNFLSNQNLSVTFAPSPPSSPVYTRTLPFFDYSDTPTIRVHSPIDSENTSYRHLEEPNITNATVRKENLHNNYDFSANSTSRLFLGTGESHQSPMGGNHGTSGSLENVCDLANLPELSEHNILQVLRDRFASGHIHTYIGDVLLIANPYKELFIYGNDQHMLYHAAAQRSNLPPHVYWLATQAYTRMCNGGSDQVVLVSGESGAGKTESAKHLLRHLVYLSGNTATDLHRKIVKVAPLLEAFGNARTSQNPNSSRVGKYMQLSFTKQGNIAGAHFEDYMLEKSRVAAGRWRHNESNFHIFYYLFAGMPQEKLKYYYLEEASEHRILRPDGGSRVFASPEVEGHCARMFTEVQSVLYQLGFTEEDVVTLYTCLAAVLLLTNINFRLDNGIDGVVVDNEYVLNSVADLLMVDETSLTAALISSVTHVNGENVVMLKGEAQAEDGRDALAKALYARLFGWLVKQVNTHLQPNNSDGTSSSHIGILDMSGFENFKYNTFEQLCINLANEQLHGFFTDHVIRHAQLQYEAEGIVWKHVHFEDTSEILDLFLNRSLSAFSLLDEESRFPKASDVTLVEKWRNNLQDSPHFRCAASDPLGFVVNHYATEVKYNAAGFLEKNRDSFSNNLRDVMTQSHNDFIRDLFAAKLSASGTLSGSPSRIRPGSSRRKLAQLPQKFENGSLSYSSLEKIRYHDLPHIKTNSKTRPTTVSCYFRNSLQQMMRKLQSAEPLFIRCIKPNDIQSSDQFCDQLVARQLAYSGALQVAKIRQAGYPVHILHPEFTHRFDQLLQDSSARKLGSSTVKVSHILKTSEIDSMDYAIGKTKVFLKEGAVAQLHHLCKNKAAVVLQSQIRTFLARKRFLHMRSVAEQEAADRLAQQQLQQQLLLRQQEQALQEQEQEQEQHPHYYESDSKAVFCPVTYSVPVQAPLTLPPQDGLPHSQERGGAQGEPSESREENTEVDSQSQFDSDDDTEDIYEPNPMWDLAQLIPRERVSASESFGGFLRCLRVLMYVFLFLALLGGAVTSQGSLLLLTAGMAKDNEHRTSCRAQLLWVVCVPHLLVFITSFFKALFGRTSWPSPGLFLTILVTESLNCLGVVLLVFRVLPYFGSLYGLSLLYSTCLIPAVFKLLFSRRKMTTTTDKCRETVKCIVDLFAILAQLCAIGLPLLVQMFSMAMYKWLTSDMEQTFPEWPEMHWQVPLALLLISVKWWENFAGKNLGPMRVFDLKRKLQDVRVKMSALTSLLNVGLTLGFVTLLEYLDGQAPNFPLFLSPVAGTNSTLHPPSLTSSAESAVSTLASISPGLLNIFSGFLTFYLGGLACKLQMQRTSFSFPLYLATPILATIMTLQCRDIIPSFPAASGMRFEWLCEYGGGNSWYILAGAIWWASTLWVAGHVWFPRLERLAKTEKVFVTPFYLGPLLVPSLLLNRRKYDNELLRTGRGTFVLTDRDSMSSTSRNTGTSAEDYSADSGTERSRRDAPTPVIYACATMWHEKRQEMIQLLKSIFRMDSDQSARRLAQAAFKITDPDYYEFEAHILFDDAYETNSQGRRVYNQWVVQLTQVIDEAASAVMEVEYEMVPPSHTTTPYGGRLTWILPGGNQLVIHMKDCNKIRGRKRWSQVMYMYYLLGFKLFGQEQHYIQDILTRENLTDEDTDRTAPNKRKVSWAERALRKQGMTGHFGKSQIFDLMEQSFLQQAENTYILALDGDVDFKPDAVRLLLDRMRKNQKTGAACGRIHPIGSGPMVWYQKFEYALGHWFQKSTEHVLGCVLCSPGCFSLFRGSALLDDNVMKKYTTRSAQASHYLQFDQGEDRWLCTLLLQQGYKVEYTAASDALTYAPETFGEFCQQRKRWIPSTLANITDLLSDYANTVAINDNISYLYMAYQLLLLISTILGPSTVVLAIASAFQSVLQTPLWASYMLAVIPVLCFIIICFKCTQQTQIMVGALLSTFYACVMTMVLVGIIQTFVVTSFLTPSLFFLAVAVGCCIIGALLHPYELGCLVHGALYFLCLPAGYLIIVIYALCNLHDIAWGTREVRKKEDKSPQKNANNEKTKSRGFFSIIRGETFLHDLKDTLSQIFSNRDNKLQVEMLDALKQIRKDLRILHGGPNDNTTELYEPLSRDLEVGATESASQTSSIEVTSNSTTNGVSSEAVQSDVIQGEEVPLDVDESIFWHTFLRKYLKPLAKDETHEKKIGQELWMLRNNIAFAFWLLNALWVILNYMIQKDTRLEIHVFGLRAQPLSFGFLCLFVVILLLQLLGLLLHRWSTFLQLLAITDLRAPWRPPLLEQPHKLTAHEAVEVTRELQKARCRYEPAPDYDIDDSDQDDDVQMQGNHAELHDGNFGPGHHPVWGNFDAESLHNTVRQLMRQRRPLPARFMSRHVRINVPDVRNIDHAPNNNLAGLQAHVSPQTGGMHHHPINNTLSRAFGEHVRRRFRPMVLLNTEDNPNTSDMGPPLRQNTRKRHFIKNTHVPQQPHVPHQNQEDSANHFGTVRRLRRQHSVRPQRDSHISRGNELEHFFVQRLDRWIHESRRTRNKDGPVRISMATEATPYE